MKGTIGTDLPNSHASWRNRQPRDHRPLRQRCWPNGPGLWLAAALLAGGQLLPITQAPLLAADDTATDDVQPSLVPDRVVQQRVGDDTEGLSPSEQSQLMYEVMIAELAGRRGYLDIATEGYRAASERTDDPRVAERATKLAMFSRKWNVAAEAGERWAELDPANPEVHQLLSQVHLRNGNATAAADALAQLVEQADDDKAAAFESIYMSLSRDVQPDTGLATMQLLAERYPEHAGAHLALARLALTSNERELALTAANEAIAVSPDDSSARLIRAQVLMSLGRGDEGLAELEPVLEADPDNKDLQLGYARLLVEAGRYDAAAEQLETVYRLADEDSQALFTIGLLAIESRRYTAAQRYFGRLVELGEYASEAHFYLGRIADNQQQYSKAIEHYEQVGQGDSYVDAQLRAAELYGLIGELDIGRERIKELARAHPDAGLQPRFIRAEARLLQQDGQSEAALETLSRGLEQFPGQSDLLYSRALMAERVGKPDIFIADLQQLIDAEPDNAHALNALGYHYADEQINLDDAEKLLVRANELLPQDPAILDSLGWLYYRQGDHASALDYLRRAYALLEDPEIAAHLGEVLWVTGEEQSARDVWDRALLETPEDDTLKSVVERFVQ